MTTATIEELDEMRKERNINMMTIAVCCGGKENCWSTAINNGHMSKRFKRNAVKVFKFYDEHGIVPMPQEIELEPIGILPKN